MQEHHKPFELEPGGDQHHQQRFTVVPVCWEHAHVSLSAPDMTPHTVFHCLSSLIHVCVEGWECVCVPAAPLGCIIMNH